MMQTRQKSVLTINELRALQQGPYSLQIHSGECVVITGESGAGKSVFLRLIADLIPSEGQVYLGDKERNQFSPSEWRQQVTYIAAESGWWAKRLKSIFLI